MQWDASRGGPLDEFIESAAIRDEISDGDHGQVALVREGTQFVGSGHAGRILLTHDPAQHARGMKPSQNGEIDRSLGVTRTAQHVAVLGT